MMLKSGVDPDEAEVTVVEYANLLNNDYWRERERRGINTPRAEDHPLAQRN